MTPALNEYKYLWRLARFGSILAVADSISVSGRAVPHRPVGYLAATGLLTLADVWRASPHHSPRFPISPIDNRILPYPFGGSVMWIQPDARRQIQHLVIRLLVASLVLG